MKRKHFAAKAKHAQASGDKFRRLSMAYALGATRESTKAVAESPGGKSQEERRLARIARKAARKQKRENQKKSRKQRAKHFTEGYLQYITSDAWYAFRKTIFDARGRLCEQCKRTDGELHLHHLTYQNLGNEKPKDVKILCRSCHEELHAHMKCQ